TNITSKEESFILNSESDYKSFWASSNDGKKKASNLKEIENFIELYYKCIQNEQSKMLNSLLDRPYNKVKIDRVLDQKEENLLTHATEIKDKTWAFFQSQYKKRNTNLEDLLDKWKEIYKPQE
ncbi:35459_t:CDS:2, partial [Gigaspora margarita]